MGVGIAGVTFDDFYVASRGSLEQLNRIPANGGEKQLEVSYKKNVFLKYSQNSQENTCVGASACNFIKKETPKQVFL